MKIPQRCAILLACLLPMTMLLGVSHQPRQGRLNPNQPEKYLELGESLLASAEERDEIETAYQVLAMGAVLAHRAGEDQLAASCCIALASGQDNPDHYQEAWDMALLLDPSRLAAWAQQRELVSSSNSPTLAAECVRMARNADIDEAAELYQRPNVRNAIHDAASHLGYRIQDVTQAMGSLLSLKDRDDCRGRVFYAQVQDGKSTRVLCSDHSHPIGTAGNADTMQMLLAIEMQCLDANDEIDAWGSAWVMHERSVMRAPSIGMLIERYRIDPARPYLVDGQWSARP